jgi:hypothetical protein
MSQAVAAPRGVESSLSPPSPRMVERIPASTATAVAFALSAAWVAAGSAGLLGHGLRHTLMWLLVGGSVVAAGWRGWAGGVVVLIAIVIAALCTPSILPAVNLVGVVVVVAALAWSAGGGASGRALAITTAALAIFAIYRLCIQAIPIVWTVSDWVGQAMGRVVGWTTGQALSVGPTFGGVDFIVLSGSWYGLWLAQSPKPRWRRAVWGAVGMLAAQYAYLALLSFAPAFLDGIPIGSRETPNPSWTVALPGLVKGALDLDAVAIHQVVPSNLPALGVLFHVLAVIGTMRWASWVVEAKPSRAAVAVGRQRGVVRAVVACVVAVLLTLVVTWSEPARSLEGKKIVVYGRLFGNFMKPKHGEYGHLSIGMYGNMKAFIESLGGTCVISPEVGEDATNDKDPGLSEAVLKDADALLMIYPNKPWNDPELVKRVWRYIENGGTMLVMGEHTVAEEGQPPSWSKLNELLAPSKIRVNFDSATFDVGGWLQSYQAMSHPITAGIEDSRNQFGVVIGASLAIRPPARPILIGRWGWADPGDEGSSAAMMGNHHYDAGERLGDMVLTAEQKCGKGRIVVFGDTSNITNGINVGAHAFNARLYSYLTHSEVGTPQAWWRQSLGIALGGVLVWLVARTRWSPAIALVALAMGGSLAFFAHAVARQAEIVPDGGKIHSGYRSLAYIDNSHIGNFSEESWRSDGTMGLAMNLMRNDYLTLMAPDLSKERLAGASLVVMPAPTRSLSPNEIQGLKEWVGKGGTLVMTLGWDRYEPNRELLAAFKFYLEKIPLEAIEKDDDGGEAVKFLRGQKLGWEILDVGVDRTTDYGGVYVFDIRNGAQSAQVVVGVKEGRWTILKEDAHTEESLHAGLLKRGVLPPEPLGHFKAPYLQFGDKNVYVRFHAAWPIRSSDRKSVTVVNGRDDLAVIIWRPEGPPDAKGNSKGKVVLVGDSQFATNQNLEYEGGQPFEGMRENADFWRWLISFYVRGETDWWKPSPAGTPPAGEKKRDPAADFELEGK